MNLTTFWSGRTLWRAVLGLMLSLYGVLAAAEELSPPQQVIQKTASQLQAALQKPEYKNDFKKATTLVDSILNTHVDFDRVSLLVLGQNWKTATPGQKARFKQEFRMLLVRTYTTAFTEYSDWNIRYLPLDPDENDKKVVVKTEVLQSDAQPVTVNYRMVNVGNDWKVYDVLIEGISLVQNYRANFASEIEQTGSLDQLIDQLVKRNASALKEPVAGT